MVKKNAKCSAGRQNECHVVMRHLKIIGNKAIKCRSVQSPLLPFLRPDAMEMKIREDRCGVWGRGGRVGEEGRGGRREGGEGGVSAGVPCPPVLVCHPTQLPLSCPDWRTTNAATV